VGNIVTYVKEKVTAANGGTAEWPHIPAAEIEKLTELFDDFHRKHMVCKGDPTSADRLARKEAADRLEEFMRYFIKRYLNFDPVTDVDREKMHLHLRDTKPTPQGPVSDGVEVTITNDPLADSHRHILHYKREGASNKAKAPWHLVVFQTHIQEPDTPDPMIDGERFWSKDFINLDSPYTHQHLSTDAGKTCWYRAHWEASNGAKGPLYDTGADSVSVVIACMYKPTRRRDIPTRVCLGGNRASWVKIMGGFYE
jgi:hypothetical protein